MIDLRFGAARWCVPARYVTRDVFGIVLDPSEERRSARVLPRYPEELQARAGTDAALVREAAGWFSFEWVF